MLSSWYSYFPIDINDSMQEARNRLPVEVRRELLNEPSVFNYQIAVDASQHSIISRLDSSLGIGTKKKFVKQLNVETDSVDRSKFHVFVVRPKALEFSDFLESEAEIEGCTRCGFGREGFRHLRLKRTPKSPINLLTRSKDWNVYFLLSSNAHRKAIDCAISGLSFREIESEWYLGTVNVEVWSRSVDCVKKYSCEDHAASISPLAINETWNSQDFLSDFCILRGTRVGEQRIARVPTIWTVSEQGLQFLLDRTRLELATVRLNEVYKPVILDQPNATA